MNIRSIITALLSLATAAVATTGFGQDTPPSQATSTTLPVQRTLTDTGGRKIEFTITEKTATGIKGKTAGGKEFTLELAKLSVDDQSFIAGLTAAPVKKLRALVVNISKAEIQTALEARGFEIVRVRELIPPAKGSGPIDLTLLTAAKVAEFDLIWVSGSNKGPEEIRECLKTFKGVVAYSTTVPGISRSKVLKDDPLEKGFVKNAYVKADDNFVFYCDADSGANGEIRERHPENIDKAADQLVLLIKKYHR